MLAKKLSTITPSFTIGISTKVKELKAQGIDIVNLSIGEPDFFTPEKAKTAAIDAVKANKTKYDAAAGLNELRQAIVKKLKTENNLDYDLSEIVVSSGAKHAITNALIAITDPGDEIIIPKPYWVSYPEMVKLTGGTPVFVDTQVKNNFKLTAKELANAITDNTKAIFITNPSNPTGAVYSKAELQSIVDICIEKQIYIFADEIYERICYVEGFTSIASFSAEAKEITITINGLSKSAAMTGWRLGYTATNKTLAKAISSIQGHLVSHPSTITQWAATEAINHCQEDTKEMVKHYTARRNEAIELFSNISELSIIDPDGAFYVFINISELKQYLGKKESYSIEICNVLLNDYKLALVPGIAFGNDHFIRMSYAASIENVRKGIKILSTYIDAIKSK